MLGIQDCPVLLLTSLQARVGIHRAGSVALLLAMTRVKEEGKSHGFVYLKTCHR